jgi:DNA adenine methylase
MKPLYKWPGGKTQELNSIKQYIPEGFKYYVEPFFGGGALFFELESPKNIINDFNTEVINFLNIIKKGDGKEIHSALLKLSNDEKTYYKIRSWKPETKLENAIRFYYLRKTCFRGMIRYNSSGIFNVPYGNYKTFKFDELLEESYVKLLNNTIILNEDYKVLFNKYNDKDYFCFIDPPYHNAFNSYTSDGFNDEEHLNLYEVFKSSQMKCLMIIGKTDYIQNIYKDFIVEEYGKKYSITRATKQEKELNQKRSIKESVHLVIKNY